MSEKLLHVPGCSCCDVVGDSRCENLRVQKPLGASTQVVLLPIRPNHVHKPQVGGWADPAMED